MTIFLFFGSLQQPSCRASCIPGARGQTPLRSAARNGHAAVVELLISAGAAVDVATNMGRGPGRVFSDLFLGWR